MSTQGNLPDFDSMMDGLTSGKIGLSVDAPRTEQMQGDSEPAPEPAEESTEPKSNMDSIKEYLENESEEKSEELSAEAEGSDDSEEVEASSEETEEVSDNHDIETINVTGPKGRQKVKVDFSDREQLKKYVSYAYGGRKWKKERDDAQAELSKLREDYSSMDTDWKKLEDAYQKDSVKGVVELLGQDYEQWFQNELARREAWSNMTDSERKSYERDEALRRAEEREKDLEAKFEAKLSELNTEREQADLRAFEAKAHPSFDRYRFSGKLGDPVTEHRWDKALWNQALENLEEIPDEIEITQAMIDKEFRRVATEMRRGVQMQVEKNTKKVVDKKKRMATSKAQATARKGIKQNSSLEEFRNNMKSGNLADSLRNWITADGGKFK